MPSQLKMGEWSEKRPWFLCRGDEQDGIGWRVDWKNGRRTKRMKDEEFPDVLPPQRGRPVAGLRPVSSHRAETCLPSETEEGSSVETQGQWHHILAVVAVSHLTSDPPVTQRSHSELRNEHLAKLGLSSLWSSNGNEARSQRFLPSHSNSLLLSDGVSMPSRSSSVLSSSSSERREPSLRSSLRLMFGAESRFFAFLPRLTS